MNFQQALLSSLGSNGEAQAIDNGGKGILYSALYADAKKVADVLLQDQPGKETVVGVAVNDRTGLIVSMIGVIAARCVFVPIDLSLPEKRLAGMMEELNLQHIITSKAAAFRFEGIKQYFLEDMLDREVPNPLVLPEYDGEDSLYVYFTSGSTGTPKGIVGRNSSLLQFIQWEIAAFNVRPGIRVSQLIHPYFDAFLRDVFVPLLAGGTVCIPPADEDLLTPGKLIAWIDESRVNLIHCVPSVFRQLNGPQLRAEHFAELQYVLLSGEKIIPAELDSWYRIFGPRIQLVNFYGATETTMIRAWYRIKPEDVKMARIPIGVPIADTELVVLDGDLNPCDTLVPGDLYIVSDYVSKGYLRNDALTREKFLRLGSEERTAYRTGDRARVLTDGNVDLLGREDRQIKLRGIRIEPEEIENVLLTSGSIKTAVVCTKEEENGDASLAAFVIRAEGGPEGEELIGEVKQHLQQYLPEYMIPASIVEVKEYPLLGNGKINYKALGQLLADRPIVAPVDAFEEKLLTIWKEILGDKAISTEDSFHKIGGNSLSIMKLIGRVYKEFNVRIALSDVFNNLTIRKQAQLIRNTNKNLLYVIPRVAAKPAYHVSSAQERMYYNQELNKAATAYNLPMAWHIHGDLDRGRLVEAFRKLIERHEGLRTSFRLIDGELFQEVKDSVEFGIEEIFLSGQDCGSAILSFTRPFDLSQAPLLRCGIISNGTEDVLVVDLHHIICDGLSQMNLLNDLMEFYIGGALKPLDKQYKDYAEWEYHFKTTDEYIAHREFWLRTFEGELPVLHLPTTGSDGGEVSERGGSTAFSLDHADIRAILDLLKQEGMTPFPGLFALYFLFLSQLTGQEDIVIGVASSGRMQEELEDVAGMFVKTLPIRYRLDFNQSLRNIIKEINKYLILATSRQVYDLTNIVEELNSHNSTPIKSLFDVMFVYQNYDEDIRKKGEMAFTRFTLDAERAKYPLTLFIYEHEDYFGCKLEYLSSYFTKEDIDILIAQFRGMAADLSSNIDAEIIEVIGSNEAGAGSAADTREEDISFNL